MTAAAGGATNSGGPSTGQRVAFALVGAAAAYFVFVFHSPADPTRWSSTLPPNDSATLERMREAIPDAINQKLLDDHLGKLDREEYGAAARKLHEFVARHPDMAYVISGALMRRAEGLLAGERPKDAEVLARGAVTIAENDWRAWAVLEEAQRAQGDMEGADQSATRVADLRIRYPVPTGLDYAIGVGVPLLAALFFWLVAPRVLPSSETSDEGPGPGVAAGETTVVGVAAPVLDHEGDEEGPGGQTITRVLGAEGRLEQARLFIECGQWEDALPIFKKATELNPASSRKVVSICIEEGKKFYDAKDTAKAEQCFQVAVEYDPADIRAQTYLANCMVKLGNFEKATAHYLEVCSIDPQGAIGFYNLGICYEKTQQPDSAVKAFQHALRLDPKMANAHYYLAKIYEGRASAEEAAKHWQQVVSMSPGTPQAQRAQERLAALGK